MPITPDDNLLSINKASSLLGVSPDTLRRLDNRGQVVPTRGTNGERLYSANDITLLKQVIKKPADERVYSIQEAANILKVSPQTIRRWDRGGKITTTRTPGGQRFFTLKDIQTIQNLPPKPLVYEQGLPEYTPPAPFAYQPAPEPGGNTVVSVKKKNTKYIPYAALFLLLLFLVGSVAFIGSRTFFKSGASNTIEEYLSIASPVPTPLAVNTENPIKEQIQQATTAVSGMFKKGSVIFQGENGKTSEDNNNLFWDATNAFLGIGTNLPDAILTVAGKAGGAALLALKGQGTENILSAMSSGQEVVNIDHAGNTQIAGSLSDINDSSLNVLQNLAVGGDVNVAGEDITSSNDLRVYSNTSTTLGNNSSPTTVNGKDITFSTPFNIFFKTGSLTNSIKLSNTAQTLPNGNTGIVDAIVDAWNHGGNSGSDDWTNASSIVYPNSASDNLAVGGTNSSSPFYVSASNGDTKVGDLTVAGGNIRLVGVNCTTYTNGGLLTTDASGNMICGNDDGGGSEITGGITGQILTSDGGSSPTWQNIVSNLTAGTDVSITGTTNATINNTSTLNTITGRGATTANTITVGNLINSGLTASKSVFTDANKQLTSTGTVGVDQGGTGQSVYTIGDMLYADTTTTLAKLADVATGKVLRSGGIGIAPAWGDAVLSITGTANQITASGGTGDITLSIPSDFRVPGTIQLHGVTYTWPENQTANGFLQTDGDGGLSWVTGISATELTCVGCVSNTELANSGVTINSSGILSGGGTVALGGTLNLVATEADTLDSVTDRGATTTNAVSVGNLTSTGTTTFGGVTYAWPGSDAGVSGYVLSSNGAGQLSWVDNGAGGAGGTWTIDGASGVIYPNSQTVDVLIGGTATSSAKFAFTGVSGGTPTASISGTYLTSTGILATTNMNHLTIGGGTTGGIDLASPITSGTWNGTAIGAIYGGTGQTGYTTGDILYANSATTLAKLADVATGKVLRSGGIGTAPAWGDAVLSITGTANQITASGGTGDITLSIPSDFRVPGTIQLHGLTYTWPENQTANGFLQTDGDGGLSWTTSLPSGTTVSFDKITSATNTVGVMVVGTGASIGTSGAGTITATELTCTGCVSNAELANSGVTINSSGILSGGGTVALGGTLNLVATEADTIDSVTDRGATTTNAITVGNLTDSGLTASKSVFTDANKQLTSTGTVGVDQGGTGFSSYTVGDLLFADTTTTLAKLSDIVVGNVLISGGVNTAPSWNKVTLGVHTTGNYVSSLAGTANQIDVSGSTGDITLSIPNDFRVPGTIQLHGVTYTWPDADGATGQVLSTNGAGELSWATALTQSSIFWAQNDALGVLYPKNNTVDMLIGSDSTSSAKFAFTGVSGGTPTASISGTYLTSTGNLANTSMRNLTLGGATTGNVIADSPFTANSTITLPNSNVLTGMANYLQLSQGISAAGVGQFGGTTATTYSRFGTAATGHGFSTAKDVLIEGNMELDGILYLDGRIISNPNGTATIIFAADAAAINNPNILDNGTWLVNNEVNNGMAALMVNNSKGGDLFSASASGVPKFTITNDGSVGIGTTSPVSVLDVAGSNLPTTISESFLGNPGTVSAFANLNFRAQNTPSLSWTNLGATGNDYVSYYTLDTTHGILYASSGTDQVIFRCDTSTGCDIADDWTVSYGTSVSPWNGAFTLTFDPYQGVMYAGIDDSIFRCDTSTGCDATGDWTKVFTSADPYVYSLTVDTTNHILYAGSAGSGIIYRCDISATDCNASGDFTTSFDTTEDYINTIMFDADSGVLYAGSAWNDVIFRCAVSTGCDAAGDWTGYTLPTTTWQGISSIIKDTTNGVIYAGSDNNIYRCDTSTSCDADTDWTLSYATPEVQVFSMTFDAPHGKLFAGTGDSSGATGAIYECSVSTGCTTSGNWTLSYDSSEAAITTLGVDGNGIVYAGTATNANLLRLDDTGASTYATYGSVGAMATNTTSATENGALLFSTLVNGTSTEAMRILNGNVGIGTTSPGEKLVADGAIVAGGLMSSSPGTASGINGVLLDWDATSITGRITASANGANSRNLSLRASNAGTPNDGQLFLQYDGNVGIGTSSPQAGLHIETPGVNNFIVRSSASNASANTTLEALGAYRISMGAAATSLYQYYTDNSNVARYIATAGTAIDLAEWYKVGQANLDSNGSSNLNKGQLLCIDPNEKEKVVACSSSASQLVGIVSTNPYQTMGMNDLDDDHHDATQVALTGRVPLIATVQNNEQINAGDVLSSSNMTGVASKTLKAGQTVAKALESTNWNSQNCLSVSLFENIVWPEDDGTNSTQPCFNLPNGSIVGKIMSFVNVSWYDPDVYLADTGNLNITENFNSNYQLTNTTNNNSFVDRIGAFASIVVANIKSGSSEVQRLTSNSFTAFQGTVDNLLIRSGLVAANIQTNVISPIPGNTDVTVQLDKRQEVNGESTEGKFAIQNSEGTEVASIDSNGTINSEQLMVNGEATIAGTLFANDIKSKSLEDIQALLAQVQTDQYTLFAATASASLTASGSATISDDQLIVNNLYANSASIADSITLGSDLVFGLGGNTINSLSTPLQIQSLAMAPVEIMGGLVSIDTQGNVTIAGNLRVAGKMEAKGLEITDSSGAIVASIDASGSAQFADIQTKKITGSGEDRGSVEILPAEDTKGIEKSWTSSPSAVLVTSSYKTQAWVTDISEGGFTVHVSDSPASQSGNIFWWALW